MVKKTILTIDTEGPRGNDPVLYQIWGKVDNDGYYGIPKIIELCDKYSVKGLFFVDIPEIWDQGYDKIKDVILYIRKKGHDVGVHIHPHHMPNEKRQFLFEFSKDEQRKIIEECTNKYVEITGEFPKSFRAGKYGANRETLDILSDMGYQYDFSEFYSQKWCGIKPHISYILPQKYKNLTEFPVTIFKSFEVGNLYQRFDKLELTNNPKEMIYVLNEYSKTSNDELLILFLHSFSFLNFLDSPDNPTLNKKNLDRFETIIKYVKGSPKFKFISEKNLSEMKIPDSDSVDNVIKTNGFFRQLFYFYNRAYEIKKTNKKAKLLFGVTWGVFTVTLIGVLLLIQTLL